MLTVALDDPVPADSAVAVVEPDFCRTPPHHVESEVRRTLLAEPELNFASLVVRRVPDGVCLEGVLESGADAPDVCSLARQVLGVERVINHLLVRSRLPLPRKKR
jgi:hypothetical protein